MIPSSLLCQVHLGMSNEMSLIGHINKSFYVLINGRQCYNEDMGMDDPGSQ